MALSGLRAALSDALGNKPLRKVVFAYSFSNLSSALLGNLGLIVFTFTFGLDNREIAFIVGVQFLFAMLSQPVWDVLSRRIGKMRALVIGFALSVAGSAYFSALVLLRASVQGDPLAFVPFGVAVGSGIGALFSLPLSMVADTVDLDESEGGTRKEGLYFGALTLSYKLAQAAALVVIGALIDLSGFDASAAVQPDGAVVALGLVLGLGGCASFASAILAIRRYPLTEARVRECRERIAARKAAAREGIARGKIARPAHPPDSAYPADPAG